MLRNYWKALRKHLPAALAGAVATVIAAAFAVLGVGQAWVPFAVIAVVALSFAQFRAWRDAWNDWNDLAERLTPRLKIECGDAPEFAAVQLRSTRKHLLEDPPDELPAAGPCYLKTVAVVNPSVALARRVHVRVVAVEIAPSAGRDLQWVDLFDSTVPMEENRVCDIPAAERRHAILSEKWPWTDSNNKPMTFGGLPMFDLVGRTDSLVVEITASADEGPTAKCLMRITGAETTMIPNCERLDDPTSVE